MKKLMLVLTLVFAVVASQTLFAQDKPEKKKVEKTVEKKVEKKMEWKDKKGKKECKDKMECCKDGKCCEKCTGEKCDGKCCEKCAKCEKMKDKKCAMDSTARHEKHKMMKHDGKKIEKEVEIKTEEKK